MFQAIIVFWVIYIPLWLSILIAIYVYIKLAHHRAITVLENNHNSLKMFVQHDIKSHTVVINGPPSIGKTRLATLFALIMEEVYIEELEGIMQSIEHSYPTENWGKYDMTKLVNDISARVDYEYLKQNHPDYLYYGVMLYLRGTFIASIPFAINSPYADTYSVKAIWDWFRPFVSSTDSPFEPYTIAVISELDKEYNSHDNKDDVSNDGFHIDMGTSSHQTDRHHRRFIEWQIGTQVPLRIRGNSEYFIEIIDKKQKYPIMMSLLRLPFMILYQSVDNLLNQYSFHKFKIARNTRRNYKAMRKRYDVTFVYQLLRYLIYHLSNILMWFSLFDYIRYNLELSDFEKKKNYGKAKIYINAQDEIWRNERLYDSTFLKNAYRNKSDSFDYDPKWAKLERWSGLNPTQEELKSLNSRFINSAFLKTTSPSDDGEIVRPQF